MKIDIEEVATKIVIERLKGEDLGSGLTKEEISAILLELIDSIEEWASPVCEHCFNDRVLETQIDVDDFEEKPCYHCED